ncbi:MAG: hypothetical protein Q9174_004549, partial [Haloplaca sp. 1 TL-2023]
CASLESAFPGKTFSRNNQANLYRKDVASYFSVQDRLEPDCFIAPSNTKQVSQIVGLLSKGSCKFAIRSGGHGLPVGASNIAKGVTIDLTRMKEVTLSEDKTTVSVGTGALWGDVYAQLDAIGYGIPGGRAGGVGVGGLTLGGGNSFYAARYGFVCDNVKNFEVVLGNGTVVQANNQTNGDLFTALKGSHNNLGLVTRFDIVAFKSGPLYGGIATYPESTARAQLPALVNFTDNVEKYPFGSLLVLWTYLKGAEEVAIQNLYEYTGDVEGLDASKPPSPEFDAFTTDPEIGEPIAEASTLRIDSLTNLTLELDSPPDLSNLYASITFSNNLTVLNGVVDILEEKLAKYRDADFFTYVGVQFQPLPRVFTEHGLDRGGNVLGLDRYTDNNLFFLFDIAWNGTQYDDKIRDVADEVIGALQEYTNSVGALKDFQYINYAYYNLNPLGGYGTAALDKIKAASLKYDPQQVFQKLVPGGFKLADAADKGPLPLNPPLNPSS